MQTTARSIAAAVPMRAGLRVREPVIRQLGLAEYRPTYDAMRRFTEDRGEASRDELWILEHPAVYTTGLAGRKDHYPRRSTIPVERVDRGGQITYHGPGQAIVYALVDLARRGLSVRAMVTILEQSVIDTLAADGLDASRRSGAPGVYVRGAKIAALGLRVRQGCCYHGLALNVNMDLAPFSDIDPCGYPGLEVTQTSALGIAADANELGRTLAGRIGSLLER